MARIIVPKHVVKSNGEIPALLKTQFPDLLPMKIKSYSHYYFGTITRGNQTLMPIFQRENGTLSIKGFV
ncbi:hypothetical protein [Lacihabitans sp. CS3-21]|jgi:hypothetical protein|uniref:hypothetical protein n=1 Tax=Lacihabitans sp. CS3-21 TaxID=2487332 RepID=UPI0020CC91B4|nr:hypothetical protein [Lacihabitans sp. CS3-21]MCP9749139.1 hypothetical protein [Lacihabitans sp. CS3-21]MDP1815966.1 hypothetical protein [Leadbetterella sp.]